MPPAFPWSSSSRPNNDVMTELVLIRHGETDCNRELRFQGQIDVPLNATGQAQARRLADRLAAMPASQLVSSDLLRAKQTAQAVAAQHADLRGATVRLEAGLREQAFGVVDGLRVADIKARHASDWDQWLRFDADFAFPGGETTRAFHARVMDALMALVTVHVQQSLVIVTHGGVLDMVYRSARGLSLSGPRVSAIPNAALNRVRVREGGGVEIVDWADTRHLSDMPPQPVYDQLRLARRARPHPPA